MKKFRAHHTVTLSEALYALQCKHILTRSSPRVSTVKPCCVILVILVLVVVFVIFWFVSGVPITSRVKGRMKCLDIVIIEHIRVLQRDWTLAYTTTVSTVVASTSAASRVRSRWRR